MNYKSIFFVLLSTVLIFSSCNKSSELSDSIPADAKYVMHVDTKSLINKSEYDVFQNETVQRAINMGKAFLKDKDQIKLIDDFLKDANSLGVNLKDELYIYTDYSVYGIVLKMDDAKKFKEVLIKSSLVGENKITEESGNYMIQPERDVCIIWNNDKVLLLVNISNAYSHSNDVKQVDIVQLAKTQLSQSSDKSINSNKAYQEFSKEKKDLSIFYTIKGLDQVPQMSGMLTSFMGKNSNLQAYFKEVEGLSAGVYGSFEKGEIQYTSKFFYDSPEVEKRIKEIANNITGSLKGDHLKYITPDPLLLASVNVKGKGVEGYLKSLEILDFITNNASSTASNVFSTVIKSLDGDVTFAITDLKTGVQQEEAEYPELCEDIEKLDPIPQFIFLADISNPDEIVKLIRENLLKDSTKVKEIVPSVFLSKIDYPVYFGTSHNKFFATNIETVYNSLDSSDLNNIYTDKIKGKSAFVFGDLQVLNQCLSKNEANLIFSHNDLKALIMITSLFQKYEMSVSATDLTSEGKLELKDKQDNSLKTICKFVDKQINESASSLLR